MSTMEELTRPGTVVRYTSIREGNWCREGLAVADDQGRLFDTYWASGNDMLSDGEIATAEVLFNLADYRELDRGELDRWSDYRPDDRQVITAQHGLRRRLFVRVGAAVDLETRIQNARDAVRVAEEKVSSAEWSLQFRRDELALLLNEPPRSRYCCRWRQRVPDPTNRK